MSLATLLRSALAWASLTLVYGVAWMHAVVLRRLLPVRQRPIRRLALIGSFHNPGWYRSHVAPLAASGLQEVLVVTDALQTPLPNVRVVCPPRWLRCCAGRTLSKLLTLLVAGSRLRADMYMGYHLFPGACCALLAACWTRRAAAYQMTAGPVEVLGGGFANENRVMSALTTASASVERLARQLLRCFELIVVRGQSARAFVQAQTPLGLVRVVPGSLPADDASATADAQGAGASRDIDMVFVGRLTPFKQPDQFLEIAAKVAQSRPNLRVVVVGDGPLIHTLRDSAAARGLQEIVLFLGQISDVAPVLERARVFVLTSRSEGLSIAMAEAMRAGVVPVVADVGELGELVRSGETGFLVSPGDVSGFAQRVEQLLADSALQTRLSAAARAAALAHMSSAAVAQRWAGCWRELSAEATCAEPAEALTAVKERPHG